MWSLLFILYSRSVLSREQKIKLFVGFENKQSRIQSGGSNFICSLKYKSIIFFHQNAFNIGTSIGFGNVLPENLSGYCFHRSTSFLSFFLSFFSFVPSLLFYQKEGCYGSEILSYQKRVIYGKKSVTRPPLHIALCYNSM